MPNLDRLPEDIIEKWFTNRALEPLSQEDEQTLRSFIESVVSRKCGSNPQLLHDAYQDTILRVLKVLRRSSSSPRTDYLNFFAGILKFHIDKVIYHILLGEGKPNNRGLVLKEVGHSTSPGVPIEGKCVEIGEIVKGSPWQSSGLKPSDRLVIINDTPVMSSKHARRLLNLASGPGKASIVLHRGEETMKTTVSIVDPANTGMFTKLGGVDTADESTLSQGDYLRYLAAEKAFSRIKDLAARRIIVLHYKHGMNYRQIYETDKRTFCSHSNVRMKSRRALKSFFTNLIQYAKEKVKHWGDLESKVEFQIYVAILEEARKCLKKVEQY